MTLSGEGSVRLKVVKVDEVVLPADHYQSLLSLIMHSSYEVPVFLFDLDRVRKQGRAFCVMSIL
jgi:hypothetical protein